ncbi:MAG: rhodanese-like domain-containing protein [Nitrospirota bacterium]
MGKKSVMLTIVALMAAVGVFLLSATGMTADAPQKPKIAPPCKQCHKPDENILRGAFAGVSNKTSTIQVNIGPAAWVVTYDDDTKLIGAEKWSQIPKEKEIAIAIKEQDGGLYAQSVSVKPPAKVAPEKLMSVEEVAKLVAMGPQQGNFTLVDSRPGARYIEGHIPGSINIYDAEFEKNIDKLPKEKDKLLIFYCAGPT